MRFFLLSLLCVILLVYGCARNNSSAPKPIGVSSRPANSKSVQSTNTGLLVTPGQQLVGRLASVNSTARFVVVRFPLGRMPQISQRFSVYRSGLKVGEIKISGPQQDVNIVADILAGDCQVGDEVKAD